MASSYYSSRPANPHARAPSPSASASAPLAPSQRYVPPSQAHRQFSTSPSYSSFSPYSSNTTATFGRGQTEQHHAAEQPPHSPSDEPSSIKCSNCSAWVSLDLLGEHVCLPVANGTRATEGLRIEVKPSGHDGWGAAKAQSPMYSGNHLSPSPPGSAPLTPAASPPATGNRLPFFERYQKLVDTTATSSEPAGKLAAAASIRRPSPSPRAAPAGLPSRSPTAPLPTSTSAPNLSVPSAPYQPYSLQRSEEPHLSTSPSQTFSPMPSAASTFRQISPVSSRSGASDSLASSSAAAAAKRALPSQQQQAREAHFTPESSAPSSSSYPSSTRQRPQYDAQRTQGSAQADLALAPSLASSAASSRYLPYDRSSASASDSIRSSQSTPADLSALANGAGGPDGLDACLEDLRILAEDGLGMGGGAEAMLDERFYDGGAMRTQDARALPADGFTADDLLATPRAPTRQPSRPRPSDPTNNGIKSSSRSLAPPVPTSLAANRFLPKCRKCLGAIEGSAVSSKDGKVVGKYHARCFRCFECDAQFEGGEFYVFDGKPYCQLHYHALNGSLCANHNCGKPIEGSCVSLVGEENGGGGRFPLLEHHFVVNRLPYCEAHAGGPVRRRPQKDGAEAREVRAKKRQTIITRR
ncbi:hypothetical protein Rhopal_000451-T1 [Rhodotorula paludigena]|uniref:LIM zinc-binding domain-containing protein n=1 Tax=Rhodotorula paludigena TaxID=86838 RepID=A0AAV5GEK0_9BASI|nr:hypothetical protein Rhopal_000451-T1 [Rhodotorula paludigena]